MYPAGLYPVKIGATAIWERWDGIKSDGSFQDAGMNSYNHYAYEAIGGWMYQNMAGIDWAEPGFKKVKIAPKPGGGITSDKGSYESFFGTIITEWSIVGGQSKLSVTIPAKSSAQIMLPNATSAQVIAIYMAQNLKVVSGKIEVSSGLYEFVY